MFVTSVVIRECLCDVTFGQIVPTKQVENVYCMLGLLTKIKTGKLFFRDCFVSAKGFECDISYCVCVIYVLNILLFQSVLQLTLYSA